MQKVRNLGALVTLGAASLVASPAFAQTTGGSGGADYSSLTSAVDWSTAITAMIAVGGILATVLVARKGIRFVLGALK